MGAVSMPKPALARTRPRPPPLDREGEDCVAGEQLTPVERIHVFYQTPPQEGANKQRAIASVYLTAIQTADIISYGLLQKLNIKLHEFTF